MHRSTFLPLQHAATLIFSVDWGLDKVLSHLISGLLDLTEKRLCEVFPARSYLFHDAFWAHRHAKYNLSVPVFLIQADGIWTDRFGKNLFDRNFRRKQYTKHIEQYENLGLSAFLFPLEADLPTWASGGDREASFDDLNRHQIIHGERVNYGSEVFSLKAIAFLDWARWVVTLPSVSEFQTSDGSA